ncbi:MAG: hypothetical protein QXG98_04685 [Candidatus Micrarchaeia archaeon]
MDGEEWKKYERELREKEEKQLISIYSSLAELLKVFIPQEAFDRLDNPKGWFERFMKWSGLDFIIRRNFRTANNVFFEMVERLGEEERKHLENVAAAYPGGIAEQMIQRYAELAREKGRSEDSILKMFPSLKKGRGERKREKEPPKGPEIRKGEEKRGAEKVPA